MGSDEDLAQHAVQMLSWMRMMQRVLSHRIMTITALVLGACINLYAAISPDMYRAIVAVAWWPFVMWPILWSERKV